MKSLYTKGGRLILSRLTAYERRLIRDFLSDREQDAVEALAVSVASEDLFPDLPQYAAQREFWLHAIACIRNMLSCLGWAPPRGTRPDRPREKRRANPR